MKAPAPDAVRTTTPARYGFVDYATQGYLLLVGLLVLLFHGQNVAHWPLLVLLHAVTILLVHGLIKLHGRRRPGWLLDGLRHFYPVLLFAGFFRETGEVNRMFVSTYLDPFFLRLEAIVFGGQPSLTLMTVLPFRAASELFYGAYFSYYLMITGVGVALFLRNRRQFYHYLSLLCFLFYVCYVCYIFLPVVGPRLFYGGGGAAVLPPGLPFLDPPPFPEAVQSGVFYQIMAFIYSVFETPGAAFPSSHVVVAIGTAYFSILYLKRIRVLHGVAVLLLCLSTVYCRYHYAVDVLAGMLSAAVLIPTGEWCYARFNGDRAGTADTSCRAFRQTPQSSGES